MRLLSRLALLALTVALCAAAARLWASPDVSAAAYEVMIQGMYLKFPGVPQLRPEAAAEGVASGGFILLDTRSAEEYAVSHLRGARLVDYDRFELSQVEALPRDGKILVYCSVGYRSSDVAARMRQAGFTDVADLYGGIFLWNNKALPLYRGDAQVDQIHPYDDEWGRWITRGHVTTAPRPAEEHPVAPAAPVPPIPPDPQPRSDP